MILQPILIAGPPRSGTTMLAGLIAKHGVWVGRARTTWFPGSNSNFAAENLDIKNVMKEYAARRVGYKNWTVPLPNGVWNEDDIWVYKDSINNFVPNNTTWLVKTSWTLAFHHFWLKAYPKAKWILPARTPEAIFDSTQRHPRMRRRPENMRRKFIAALQERQNAVAEAVGERSLRVDVHKVSQANAQALSGLFGFLGLRMSEHVVEDWLEPGRMKK